MMVLQFPGTVEDGIILTRSAIRRLKEFHSAVYPQVTRTAQFQIGLGNNETVVALGHDLHPLSGIGRVHKGDQDTVGLVAPRPTLPRS